MRKDDFQLIETMVLYSAKCINYLQQAIDNAELSCEDEFRRFYEDANLETWESDDEGKNETSSDEDEDKNDSNCNEDIKKMQSEEALNAQRNIKLLPLSEEQKEDLIRKLGMPPSTMLTLSQSTNGAIEIPLSLISKEQRMSNALIQSKAYHSLAIEMAVAKKPTFTLLLQSGRFAASVFLGSQCLHHTTSTRYTVRKGQGRAQNSQDGRRKPKSVGSQLRRAGEEALRKDVFNFLLHNKSHLENACLILISIPKVMVKNFFNDCSQFLSREDNRIRKIPLDLGRPTFEAVVAAYEIMMKVNIVRKNEDKCIAKIDNELQESHPLPQVRKESEESNSVSQISIPVSPVHVFAAEGNLVGLIQIMTDELKYDINLRAGDDFMTPLHMASASSQHNDPNMSAACVSALLIHGRANPCLLDARFRVPYYLASHDKVREAFRLARGELGEEYCDWEEAKVGPALTRDDLNAKKMKAAEKKRRQRAKQKEKAQKELAIKEETEKNRQEENERMKREIEAKRIRDGLQPMTSTATNICDFCQQQCKGKSRRQMLQRLNYAYCSTQCVQNHKRELLAAAAMARFH
jgi:Bacteroidetes VLRF1 release factor/Vms1-associating treble clef domain